MGMLNFFRSGGTIAWGLVGAILLLMLASTALFARTALVRHERDVSRMVFNDNLQLLDEVRKSTGALGRQPGRGREHAGEQRHPDQPAISGDQHRGPPALVQAGRQRPVHHPGGYRQREGARCRRRQSRWKFETPRGRLLIQSKEEDPAWIPPDWHYVEVARKRGLGIVRLNRGQSLPASDGSVISVEGTDMVRRYKDGRVVPIEPGVEGREVVAGGNIVIPRSAPINGNTRECSAPTASTWATATRCSTARTSRRVLAAQSVTGAYACETRTSRPSTRWFPWARRCSYIERRGRG